MVKRLYGNAEKQLFENDDCIEPDESFRFINAYVLFPTNKLMSAKILRHDFIGKIVRTNIGSNSTQKDKFNPFPDGGFLLCRCSSLC